MAVELAQAYVSLTAETSKIPQQVNSALNKAQGQADSAGRGIGEKLTSGIGTAMKVTGATVAAAAGGVMATAFTQGWGRLTAIDNAQGKLKALGNDTVGVAKIMDSAMASVKGTAYGLGDAATIAATATAAGVKPGKDLTKYLSLIADTSSIAGVGLSEMGSIFGKVQTQQRAYTMEINMLADRGIPIYQWLQKELGVSQEALRDMVKAGEVDSETYFRAIEKNIGGAATAATTVSSAWSNTMAAMGRAGAAALQPTFTRLTGGLTGTIGLIDKATPAVGRFAESFDNKLFDEYAPKMLEVASSVREAMAEFAKSDQSQESLAQVSRIITELIGAGRDVAPAIGGIVKSLSQASAALGVSTWQLFLSALEAVANVANVVLVPTMNALSSVMGSNQGAVTALVGAFLVFKTVPAIMGRVAGAVTPIGAAMTRAQRSTAGLSATTNALRGDYARLAPQIGRIGAAQRALGNSSSTIRGMQNAMAGASTTAGGLARAVGVGGKAGVAGAIGGLKAGVGGLTAALGGPLVLGFVAVTALTIGVASEWGKASKQAQLLEQNSRKVADAQSELKLALFETGGSVDDTVIGKAAASLEVWRAGQRDVIANGPGMFGIFAAAGKDITGWFSGQAQAGTDAYEASGRAKDAAQKLASQFEKTNLSADQFAEKITGGKVSFDSFVGSLRNRGFDELADKLQQSRNEFEAMQATAKLVTPGIVELGVQMGILGDTASSADEKSGALKKTLDILAGVPVDAADAMADYNKTLRDTQALAEEPWDTSQGIGAELINSDTGAIDTLTANGAKLREQLQAITDSTADAGAAGNDLGPIFERNQKSFEALAASAGLTVPEIEAAAAALGYMPDSIQTLVRVSGAGEVAEELAKIDLQLGSLKPGVPKTIVLDTLTGDAETQLRGLGLTVERIMKDGQESIKVTAATDEAMSALNGVVDSIGSLSALTATPGVDLSLIEFRASESEASSALAALNDAKGVPEADLLIQKLQDNQKIALEDLRKLNESSASPQVKAEVANALAAIKSVNDALDDAARTRYMNVQIAEAEAITGRRVNRGQFATGGRLPTTGPGTGTVDGILGVTSAGEPIANVDAGEWIINRRSSAKYDRELAAMNAGTFPKLPGFATGGIAAALDAGRGVEGNKYVWGGTGPTGFDCSGFVGWLQQIVMGIEGSVKRLYTTYSLLDGATAGLEPGLGPEGTLFQVGVSQDHMAATVDGKPAESGGAFGTSGIGGGRASAQDTQFPSKFHLPNELIAGYVEGAYGQGQYAGTRKSSWTEQKELDLQSAQVAITQAEEARDKVQVKVNEGKATSADLDQANLKVQKAQQKVVDLQSDKDTAASETKDGPSPQAPALERAYTDAESKLLDAQIAVEDANTRRNDVYADADATELERRKVDAQLSQANRQLEELRAGTGVAGQTAAGGVGGTFSLKDRLKQFGSDVAGIGVDALFGQIPFGLGESRWVTTDWAGRMQGPTTTSSPVGAFTQKQVDSQMGFTPGGDELAPNWALKMLGTGDFPGAETSGMQEDNPLVDLLLRARGALPQPKVYDNGGWLNPGETAINLSSKPEPIFNSPKQLAQFADGLKPAQAGETTNDYSVHIHDPKIDDFHEFESRLRASQWQRVGGLVKR